MSNDTKETNRNLYLFDTVNIDSTRSIIEKIHRFNDEDNKCDRERKDFKRKPIKLHISTVGGSVYAGLGLIDVITNSDTPVHTYVTGCSMSMGLVIGAAGHKRFGYKHATFMYHEISSGDYGKVTELQVSLAETERLAEIYIKLLIEFTQFTESVRDIKTDLFFTAEEALNKYGVIDEII